MKYILAKKRQWTQTHKMGNIHPRTRGTNRRFLLLNSPHSISERFDAGVAQSVERQTLTHEDIWWSWVRSPPSVINFFCSITTFKLHFYTPRRGRAPSMPAPACPRFEPAQMRAVPGFNPWPLQCRWSTVLLFSLYQHYRGIILL